ncbi:hypothetical protein EW146_g775, partial [Bondarzewia mesenterica]
MKVSRTSFNLAVPSGDDYPMAIVVSNTATNPYFRAQVLKSSGRFGFVNQKMHSSTAPGTRALSDLMPSRILETTRARRACHSAALRADAEAGLKSAPVGCSCDEEGKVREVSYDVDVGDLGMRVTYSVEHVDVLGAALGTDAVDLVARFGEVTLNADACACGQLAEALQEC